MTINNAVLKNCLKLSSKITVYVPATNGIDQAADNTEQVKKTAALLSELFGGATSTPALGYWMSPAAGLVAEATTVVFAYAADAALQEHVGRVVELCEELKREMGQEAIALEIRKFFGTVSRSGTVSVIITEGHKKLYGGAEHGK